jgi:hypothetical protein
MDSGSLVSISEVGKVTAGLTISEDCFGIVLGEIDFYTMSGVVDRDQKCYSVLLPDGIVEIFYREDLDIV